MEKSNIVSELKKQIPGRLVDELFERHKLIKEKFVSGYFDPQNFDPSELNAGKFVEVVLRILQHLTSGTYTPLNRRLDFTDSLANQFMNSGVDDSVRIHIPRTARVIYDVRSRRGVGHISGNINANLMDSMLVVSVADWVLAELIRLYCNKSPEDAQKAIDSLIDRKIPLLWTLDGLPVILDPKMAKQGSLLVYFYSKGSNGASIKEVNSFLTGNLAKVRGFITQLVIKKFVSKSPKTGKYVISPLGLAYVEKNIPLEFNIN